MNPPLRKAPIAESRTGLPALGMILLWALWAFIQYFFSKTHPLAQALPFLWKIFDASPFPPVNASQFWKIQGESLRILLSTFVISGVTWALGRRVRHWLNLGLPDSWIRFAFDFGLGVCFLNLFWIGTGLERLWFRPVWLAAEAFLFLLFTVDFFSVLKEGINRPMGGLLPKEVSYLFLFMAGLFYWTFSIFQNLAPETFYDSMVYHLAVPSYWLLNHGLKDFPVNFFSNYPYGAEVYFLNGLVLQGTETAKMLHAVSFGACALLAGGWAREIAGEKAGWLTLGLTLTLPLFAVNLWSTQVEGFLSLAVVLFIYALTRFSWGEGKPMVWALIAGLFLGLALSTKYTALLAAGSALVVLALQKFSVFKKENLKYWLMIFLGSLLLLGPWVLKNLAYTGNPFFPYLMTHFPGRHLTSEGYGQLLQEQHARVTNEWWSWILLPWALTMSNPDSYNFCGPLALALAPLLFLFRLCHPVLRFLAGLVPLFLAAGFAVTHILRFVLPDFLLFYVLIGAVLAGRSKPTWGKGVPWVAGVSAILCFAYMGNISHYNYDCAGIWSGRQTRDEYLMSPVKMTPYFDTAQNISNHVPPRACLLVVGDARGLYYDRPFLTNSVFDEQTLAKFAREAQDAGGIARSLQKLGVDYLVVNGNEGVRVAASYHHYDLTSEQWKILDDFVQRDLDMVYLQGLQAVYKVRREPRIDNPQPETTDFLMLFSNPATQFLTDWQRHRWAEARRDMDEVLKLYPFSAYWKGQKAELDKVLKKT